MIAVNPKSIPTTLNTLSMNGSMLLVWVNVNAGDVVIDDLCFPRKERGCCPPCPRGTSEMIDDLLWTTDSVPPLFDPNPEFDGEEEDEEEEGDEEGEDDEGREGELAEEEGRESSARFMFSVRNFESLGRGTWDTARVKKLKRECCRLIFHSGAK